MKVEVYCKNFIVEGLFSFVLLLYSLVYGVTATIIVPKASIFIPEATIKGLERVIIAGKAFKIPVF